MPANLVMLEVRRYVWQRRHERFFCHGTTKYAPDGREWDTFSRSFVCDECGDELVDGDQGYDTERNGFIHERCYLRPGHDYCKRGGRACEPNQACDCRAEEAR